MVVLGYGVGQPARSRLRGGGGEGCSAKALRRLLELDDGGKVENC